MILEIFLLITINGSQIHDVEAYLNPATCREVYARLLEGMRPPDITVLPCQAVTAVLPE